jgi:hypothetical protein
MEFLFFLAYILLIFGISAIHSREASVLMVRAAETGEFFLVSRLGWLLPALSTHVYIALKGRGILAVLSGLSEYTLFILLKSLMTWVKRMQIILPGHTLPFNPSGHTLMLLNGIFLLTPILVDSTRRHPLLPLSIALLLYFYHSCLLVTLQNHHTFVDILAGMGMFLLLRALLAPLRGMMPPGTVYAGEWGVLRMSLFSLTALLSVPFMWIFFYSFCR